MYYIKALSECGWKPLKSSSDDCFNFAASVRDNRMEVFEHANETAIIIKFKSYADYEYECENPTYFNLNPHMSSMLGHFNILTEVNAMIADEIFCRVKTINRHIVKEDNLHFIIAQPGNVKIPFERALFRIYIDMSANEDSNSRPIKIRSGIAIIDSNNTSVIMSKINTFENTKNVVHTRSVDYVKELLINAAHKYLARRHDSEFAHKVAKYEAGKLAIIFNKLFPTKRVLIVVRGNSIVASLAKEDDETTIATVVNTYDANNTYRLNIANSWIRSFAKKLYPYDDADIVELSVEEMPYFCNTSKTSVNGDFSDWFTTLNKKIEKLKLLK